MLPVAAETDVDIEEADNVSVLESVENVDFEAVLEPVRVPPLSVVCDELLVEAAALSVIVDEADEESSRLSIL